MRWPISTTIINKMALLAYAGHIDERELVNAEPASRLLANTIEDPNRLADPTIVKFDKGTYTIELNGLPINKDAFSSLEQIEASVRLSLIEELSDTSATDFSHEQIERARVTSVQAVKDALGFHSVLPTDGNDLLKLYDWEVSNLMLLMQKTRSLNSIFSRKTGTAAVAVPIFRYPSDSEERRGNHMLAVARIHPNYGPEVVINGLLLYSIEDLLLQVSATPEISPCRFQAGLTSQDFARRVYERQPGSEQRRPRSWWGTTIRALKRTFKK